MRTLLVPCLLAALLAAPAAVVADDAPPKSEPRTSPSEAWQELNAEMRRVPRAQRSAKMKAAAEAYLANFRDTGGMALGGELLSLGFLQRAAEQWTNAANSFRAVWANEGHETRVRAMGAMHHAGLLTGTDARTAIGAKDVTATLDALATLAGTFGEGVETSLRSSLENNLARAYEGAGNEARAHEIRIALVKRDPTTAGSMYRTLLRGLMGRTHDMAGYAKVQAEAKSLLAMLQAQQAKAIEIAKEKQAAALAELKKASPDSIDADGNLKAKPMNQMSTLERVAFNAGRQLSGAERTAERMQDAGKPFDMLGTPVPAWTLEHAFGELKSLEELKGKVVVLDFWATWCPWCIRSFPAIRDLMKDYGDKGLVVVGVTASSGSVYAARYDLDDDLQDKAEAGKRATPAARQARGSQKPDGETTFSAEAYAVKEKEVIAEFIENHQMTWPVVMIDKAEPAPKYALAGWPHAVVIDREGRIRYFKSGALLRDRKEAVAAFRKVLEDLLAEKAE